MVPVGQMTMSTQVVTWMSDDLDTDVPPTFLTHRDGVLPHTWAFVDRKPKRWVTWKSC
jgi:hypothetical protein